MRLSNSPGVVQKSPRHIKELEGALQGFINASFESITSPEHAPSLLRQFQFHPPAGVPSKADLDVHFFPSHSAAAGA